MSSHPTDPHDHTADEALDEEERRRRARRQGAATATNQAGAGEPTLDEEIARKYDPRRLSRIVMKGAGRGEALDLATRSDMERLHPGHDFSGVRVFRGPFAEQITARHRADAVTVANTGMILVRETPRSAPGTTSGRALLAHELTHVAQAQRGMHFAKENGTPGEGEHEREAEAVESQVASGGDNILETAANKLKESERRRRIIERALELLGEQRRIARERSGRSWE